MEETEATLFPIEAFEDSRMRIPAALGKKIGEFFNTSRLVIVQVAAQKVALFNPTENEQAYSSPGYAEDTKFEESFAYWNEWITEKPDNGFRGYLVGFPRIVDKQNNPIACLQIWEHNSVIDDSTYAIPLLSVSGLAVYSKLRTRLQEELNEFDMGSSPRWEVPIIRNKADGELHFRDANVDDIERVIQEMDEPPTLVYGSVPVKRYFLPQNKEAVSQLLAN